MRTSHSISLPVSVGAATRHRPPHRSHRPHRRPAPRPRRMDPQQAEALVLRYGLDDHPERSYRQIGRHLKVSDHTARKLVEGSRGDPLAFLPRFRGQDLRTPEGPRVRLPHRDGRQMGVEGGPADSELPCDLRDCVVPQQLTSGRQPLGRHHGRPAGSFTTVNRSVQKFPHF